MANPLVKAQCAYMRSVVATQPWSPCIVNKGRCSLIGLTLSFVSLSLCFEPVLGSRGATDCWAGKMRTILYDLGATAPNGALYAIRGCRCQVTVKFTSWHRNLLIMTEFGKCLDVR